MTRRLSAQSIARFSAAAATGLALLGCNQSSTSEDKAVDAEQKAAPVKTEGGKNCCMGLNECKGKGGCAVPESHSCAGKNECKGKGGCNMHCPK